MRVDLKGSKMKKESEHAKLLRSLGFERVEPRENSKSLPVQYELLQEGSSSEREEKLANTMGGTPPYFLNIGGAISSTFILDEMGGIWSTPRIVDLAPYGFSPLMPSLSLRQVH